MNQRQFYKCIKEIGNNPRRFFQLKIEIFLTEKHRPLTELQDSEWLWKLIFYVDFTKHQRSAIRKPFFVIYMLISNRSDKINQLRKKYFIFKHVKDSATQLSLSFRQFFQWKISLLWGCIVMLILQTLTSLRIKFRFFKILLITLIENLVLELQIEIIDIPCSDIIRNSYY